MRGEYLYRTDEYFDACEDLEAALQLDPSLKTAAQWLARLRVLGPKQLRDPKKAAVMVAIMNAETNPDPLTPLLLGLAYTQEGRFAEGQEQLQSVGGEPKRKALSLLGISLAACRQRDKKGAEAAITSADLLYREIQSGLAPFERDEFERLRGEIEAELQPSSPP